MGDRDGGNRARLHAGTSHGLLDDRVHAEHVLPGGDLGEGTPIPPVDVDLPCDNVAAHDATALDDRGRPLVAGSLNTENQGHSVFQTAGAHDELARPPAPLSQEQRGGKQDRWCTAELLLDRRGS
jgi:hypothetical protein